jgi:hypothetical protein
MQGRLTVVYIHAPLESRQTRDIIIFLKAMLLIDLAFAEQVHLNHSQQSYLGREIWEQTHWPWSSFSMAVSTAG